MYTNSSAGHSVSLRELLPEASFHGASDLRVASVAGDSRACRPGDLFVAQTGVAFDGHDFAEHAIARGAIGVVAERLLPLGETPLCVVPDAREAFGRICQALAGNPSEHLRVIGVTGTNGKTTTSWLIASVLEAAGFRAGLLGTIAFSDTVRSEAAACTTPPAAVLADWLRRMQAAGCTHAVVEVSSHALCQSRLAGVGLDAACITNVRSDHLDYHTTVQNYRTAKARLLSHLTPKGFAVLNADDPVSASLVDLVDGPVLTVGLDAPAELTASVVECSAAEQVFLLSAGSETAAVRTRMIGDHHVSNCLMAAAVGLMYGIELPVIARGLESLEQVPGRLERIECGQPFSVFVDYAHTPDALATVLRTLRRVTAGRVICVFGAGGDRDRRKRPLMGSAVESQAHLAVVTTDNPRHEEPAAIIREILSGFESPSSTCVIVDRATAIQWALSQARPGDCVLIAGKGHEDYQEVGGARYWFDDRDVVRRWLYEQTAEVDIRLAQAGSGWVA
jgi:UDP-N-acetylmuramoyl-L-alanyl-D-glutamate--2,6-diaminopimelate ligase